MLRAISSNDDCRFAVKLRVFNNTPPDDEWCMMNDSWGGTATAARWCCTWVTTGALAIAYSCRRLGALEISYLELSLSLFWRREPWQSPTLAVNSRTRESPTSTTPQGRCMRTRESPTSTTPQGICSRCSLVIIHLSSIVKRWCVIGDRQIWKNEDKIKAELESLFFFSNFWR